MAPVTDFDSGQLLTLYWCGEILLCSPLGGCSLLCCENLVQHRHGTQKVIGNWESMIITLCFILGLLKTEFYFAAQDGLEFTLDPRLALHSWQSSCLRLSSFK